MLPTSAPEGGSLRQTDAMPLPRQAGVRRRAGRDFCLFDLSTELWPEALPCRHVRLPAWPHPRMASPPHGLTPAWPRFVNALMPSCGDADMWA
jgi:hypothetical protein